jgi:hypothetical protein
MQERLLDSVIVAAYDNVRLPGSMILSPNYLLLIKLGVCLPVTLFKPKQIDKLRTILQTTPIYVAPSMSGWIRNNLTASSSFKKRILELFASDSLTPKQWYMQVERQSEAGDANALYLLPVAESMLLPMCKICKANRHLPDDAPLPGTEASQMKCCLARRKTCGKCGQSKPGRFAAPRGKQRGGLGICSDCRRSGSTTFDCDGCGARQHGRKYGSPKHLGKAFCSRYYAKTRLYEFTCHRCNKQKDSVRCSWDGYSDSICNACFQMLNRQRRRKRAAKGE